MPVRLDDGAPFAPGMQTDPAERVRRIDDLSGQTLPTRLVLSLAQSQLADPDLHRASVLLARNFDLPLRWFWHPYDQWGARHDAPLRLFHDPGDPEQAITWSTAKRLFRPFEADVVSQMLAEHRAEFDPDTLVKVIKAIAPVAGDRVPFTQVFAAALQIAARMGQSEPGPITPETRLALFAANMQITAGATSLQPMLQIAVADEATRRGARLRTLADVARLVTPQAADLIGAGEHAPTLAEISARRSELAAAAASGHPEPARLAEVSSTLEQQFGQQIVAGLAGPGDFLDNLRETQDNYIAAAEELSHVVRVPFQDSFVGRTVFKMLDLANRPLGAAFRVAAEPITWLTDRQSGVGFGDSFKDAWDILNGRTTEFAELSKEGIPFWATLGAELLISFGFDIPGTGLHVPSLDPVILGGQVLRDLHLGKTVFGLAEAGRAGDWPEILDRFVNGRVGRIGDLRNVTVAQYLLREADRTKDPATFFNRAVDSFRARFLTAGLHPMISERIWRFAEASRKAGVPQALRERAIAAVLLEAGGVRTESGLAREIEEALRAARSRVARELPEQLAIVPAERLSRDAEAALGVLTDAEASFERGARFITEIPHRGNPIRGLMDPNPKRIGSRFVFDIEDIPGATRDFGHYLARSGVLSKEEIAQARLDYVGAVRADNPSRELATMGVIDRTDRLITSRILARYGIDEELGTRLISSLDAKMGREVRRESFGIIQREGAIEEVRSPLLVSQHVNTVGALDPALLRRSIAETIGTWRKWRASFARIAGLDPRLAKAAKIPLRRFLDGALDLVTGDILAPLKTLVVVRPAYILRVVGLEEQSRFLATLGPYRRLESGEHGARVLSVVDHLLGRERSLEVALGDEAGVLAGETLHFPRPGLLPNEPLVNNVSASFVLSSEEGPVRRLLEQMSANRWGAVTRSDPQFYDAWFNALQEQFGRDVLGRRYLDDVARGLSEQDSVTRQMQWLLDRGGEGPRYVERLLGQSISDVSRETLQLQVERGAHIARDLAAGHPELAAAARDGLVRAEDLRAVATEEVPAFVHGPLINDSVLARQGPIKRGVQWISRWILQEPTNRLSRQPYFKAWYDRMNRSLIETARESGVPLTEEMLHGFSEAARQFGIAQVRRIMFDFTREGRLDELTRHVLWFVQPFLEFPVVWSRIIRQNPAVLGYANRIARTAMESGVIQTDPDTGELVIPMSWWGGAAPLLAAVTGGQLRPLYQGGGWELSAPLTSFNLFAQAGVQVPTGPIAGDVPLFLPSLNPAASWVFQQMLSNDIPIPLKASIKARLASWLFAYGPVDITNPASLLPPYMRRFLQAAMPDVFESETNLQVTHFLQLQQAMGMEPDPDRARAQAREFAGLRGFFSLIFPAAPRIDFPTADLEQEWQKDIELYGYQQAQERWLGQYNPATRRYEGGTHSDLSLITIARTMWNEDNPSPIPIPPNEIVNQFLETRGAERFAREHPRWLWAIIPSELREQDFDVGSWFAQIASGQRQALSPEAFLGSAEVRRGWDAYFAENDRWISWQEAHPLLGQGDPPYDEAALEHDIALSQLREDNPDWAGASGDIHLQGTDPKVLAEARSLATDRLFSRTDTGQGLVAYLALRDDVADELAANNIHSVRTVTAERLGITGRFDDGVAAVQAEHPDFATAYRLFFYNDLQNVKTDGERALDRIPAEVYDTQITPWWERFEQLRQAPNAAGSTAERNTAYEDIRTWVARAYSEFTPSQNPMLLRWRNWTPAEQGDYLISMLGRGYSFDNRFDREEIFGEHTTKRSEELWTAYNQVRTVIAQREITDPNFTSGDAYHALDVWALQQAASNKAFAAQMADSNRWGFALERALPTLFPDRTRSDPYWTAFLDAVGEVQSIVTGAELHGDAEFDPNRKVAYFALRDQLAGYVEVLRQENVSFRRQWDWLEEATGPDVLLNLIVPDTWYPLGGYPGDFTS